MYKLRDWVDETQLKCSLYSNERAVEYLENNDHVIDYNHVFINENAIHIIEKRIQYDKFGYINYNKNAVNFLRNNPQYIDYKILCGVEHGIEFVDALIKNNELDKIDWEALSKNPAAMHILNDSKYYQYIHWGNILKNKNAVELVKNNLHMINSWGEMSDQPHLIDIIEQNLGKVYWNGLSANYNAIHILEKNLDKINFRYLVNNKNGFNLLLTLGYEIIDMNNYHKNIVFDYFDYCEKKNIPFNLMRLLSKYGYTEKHMEYLKNHCDEYYYLSFNPNIFEYDYKRMRETRQALLWYNDIKK